MRGTSFHSIRQPPPSTGRISRLAADAERVHEDELLAALEQSEGEVLRLAVEEAAVVETDVGAEEAVRAIERAHLPRAPQARHVGPQGVVLVRIAEAPA